MEFSIFGSREKVSSFHLTLIKKSRISYSTAFYLNKSSPITVFLCNFEQIPIFWYQYFEMTYATYSLKKNFDKNDWNFKMTGKDFLLMLPPPLPQKRNSGLFPLKISVPNPLLQISRRTGVPDLFLFRTNLPNFSFQVLNWSKFGWTLIEF